MLWIGEMEDAKTIKELETPVSITGKPIPDLDNIGFNIASGSRRILAGNFKKQVTIAEGKA